MRTDSLNLCLRHANDPDFRKPDNMPELVRALSGAEFDHTFPPVKG